MVISKGIVLSGIYSIGNNLLNVLLRFFAFFIIVRALPKNEFGIWVLFLVVISIIEVVRNGFIKNAVIKYIASTSIDQHKQIQTASLILNAIITVVSLGLLLSATDLLESFWDTQELASMFFLYSFTAFFLIFLSHLEFIGAASNRFRSIFQFNAARNLTFLILVSYNYFFGIRISLEDLVIYQAIAVFVGLIVGIIIMAPIISLGWTISKRWMNELFHFGKYVVGTNLGTMIFSSTDQIMLGAVMTTQSVAIYNAASRINNFIDAPVMGISNVFYTQSSRKGKSSFKEIYTSSVGLIMSLIIPLLVMVYFFSDQIILFVAGENYTESAGILRVTMLYSFFIPFTRQFGTLLDSIGKPHINLVLTISTSLINIVFSYLAIVRFGVIGAAYGTLVTHSVSFIIVQGYLKKYYKIVFFDIIKSFFHNYIKVYMFLANWKTHIN